MRRTPPRDSATQTAALALFLGLAFVGCGSDERSGAALSSGSSGSGASASVGSGGGATVGSGGGASSSSGTGGAGAGGGGNGGANACDGTLGLPALPSWSVPTRLAVDVDGDGKLDLIGGSVLVSINNGGGQYAPAVSYPTGAAGGSSHGLAAADLDGDGDVDFAATDVTLSALDVILNHGDGTFAAPSSFGNLYGSDQCAQSSELAAADFDGDGAVDLAIQCSTGLLVKTNAGDGTFAAVGDLYPVPLNAPIAADFDDDGHPDIVGWGTDLSGQSAIAVLLNDGTGTLLSPVHYPASYAGTRLGVTDLDGDDIPDVLTGADFQSNVSVFLNDGSGTLGPKVDYFEGGASNATAADLDEDGDADLVIGTSFGTVVVKPNQGDGTFGAATAYPTGKDGGSAFAVDLNDDGHLDLLVGNGGVLFNDGTGVFPSWIDYPVGIQPSVSVIAELNGDGLPDLAAVNTAFFPRVRVLFNTGGGAFAVGGDYPVGSVDAGDPVSIAAADFDGDGAADLVTANFASNTMSVLVNHGDGTFAAKLDYPTSAGPRDLAVADLNGDGALDIALVNGASFSGTSTFLNNGDGTFASRVDYAVPPGESLVLAELNGDTHPDLAWTNGVTGGLSIQFGVGDGTFGPNVDHAAGWSTSLTAADLNGDGAIDLAATSDSAVTLLLNTGGGSFAPASTIALPAGFTYGLDAADFDANGGVDLLLARNKSTLGLLWSTGNGTFASPAYYVAGADPIAVTTGDLDGDGRPDVVLTNLYDVDGDNAAAVSVLLDDACLP